MKFSRFNKKFKYIYADHVYHGFTCNAFYNVAYGNKRTKDMTQYTKRWPVASLLRGFTVYKTGRTYDFISNNEPNEAEIIRGLYLFLRYQYNHARNVLRKYNKREFKFEHDQQRLRTIVRQARKEMMIWKRRYDELNNAGVYSYIELMK